MTLQRYEFILKQQIKVWRIITTKSFNISYPLPFPTFHDRSPCRVPPGRLTMSGQPPHCASGLYGVTEVASLRDAPLLRGLSPHCASGLYGVIEVASLRDASPCRGNHRTAPPACTVLLRSRPSGTPRYFGRCHRTAPSACMVLLRSRPSGTPCCQHGKSCLFIAF